MTMNVPQTIESQLEQCRRLMVSEPMRATELADQIMSRLESSSASYVNAGCYRGLCLFYQGEHQRAETVLTNMLSLAIRHNQPQNERRLRNALGLCHHALGQYHVAIEHYEICAALARQDNQIKTLAPPLINLAKLLVDIRDVEASDEILMEVMGQDLADVDASVHVEIYLLQARILIEHNELEHVPKALAMATDIADDIGFQWGLDRAFLTQAWLMRLEGNVQEAFKLLFVMADNQAEQFLGVQGIYIFADLAELYYSEGRYELGVQTLLRGFEKVNLPEYSPQRLTALDCLAKGYAGMGELDKQIECLLEVQHIERSGQLQQIRNILGARELKRHYEQEKMKQKLIDQEHQMLKDDYKRLTLLNDIAHQIAMTLNFSELGTELYNTLEQHFGIHFMSLSTLNDAKTHLEHKFVIEYGQLVKANDIRLEGSSTKSAQAMKLKLPVVINDLEESEQRELNRKAQSTSHSLLYVPLILEREVLGVFSMQSTHANRFHEYEVHLMSAICKFMAIAVSNISSHQRVKELNDRLLNEKKVIEEAQERIEYLAYHDGLTTLPNRQQLEEFVERRIYHQSRPFHLVYIDLDAFKPINDLYGHRTGDAVLIKIAERLKASLRHRDFASRVGGDEFVLVVDQFDCESDLEAFLNRVRDGIDEPIQSSVGELSVSASIGFARFPDDGETLDSLMHHADVRMYAVKRGRKTP